MADKSAVIELSEEVKQRRDLILRNLQVIEPLIYYSYRNTWALINWKNN